MVYGQTCVVCFSQRSFVAKQHSGAPLLRAREHVPHQPQRLFGNPESDPFVSNDIVPPLFACRRAPQHLASVVLFTNDTTTQQPVRDKSRELVSLLGNPDLIQAQRRNARDLKPQYNGYGGDMPRRLSGGSGGSSRPPHDSSGGGGGRNSGEISDDWRAGYDRSPTPPHVDARRVVGGRSESIDFDEGREGYSGRLSRFQEQEKREASLALGGRRFALLGI